MWNICLIPWTHEPLLRFAKVEVRIWEKLNFKWNWMDSVCYFPFFSGPVDRMVWSDEKPQHSIHQKTVAGDQKWERIITTWVKTYLLCKIVFLYSWKIITLKENALILSCSPRPQIFTKTNFEFSRTTYVTSEIFLTKKE